MYNRLKLREGRRRRRRRRTLGRPTALSEQNAQLNVEGNTVASTTDESQSLPVTRRAVNQTRDNLLGNKINLFE